jgi:cytoskeletal protein RodZ
MKLRNTQKQQEYPVGKVERDQRTAGLGEQLKNARENAGLSIQDVANSLKLSPTLVSALENDDYSPLPEPVFVHGYIRNYANIVNLSPDRLLRSYDHGGTPSPNLTVTPTVSTRFQWTDTLVLSALGLSTLLLLALLTLFFPQN